MAQDEVGPGDLAEVPERNADPRRLVMFAAPARRPDDGIDLTMTRLQQHNALVTQIVLDELRGHDGSTAGTILKYLEDGVLVAFELPDAGEALRASVLVMQRLQQVDGGLASRIGLSAGEILSPCYDPRRRVPADRIGKPIEIAARLVSDVAEEGQIVLDDEAQAIAFPHLNALKPEVEKPCLHPMDGAKLTIEGIKGPIAVYELSLTDLRRTPQNRRQLARELSRLKLRTVELRFKLRTDRADISDGKLRESDLDVFEQLVELLDPDRPKNESQKLESAWRDAHEAQKVKELISRKETLLEACRNLRETWEREELCVRAVDVSGRRARASCMNAYAGVTTAVKNFSAQLTWAIEDIEEML
jgi:hypothetical protein